MRTKQTFDKSVANSRSRDRILSVQPHAELPAHLAPERVLNVRQSAELFGVSVATFRRLHSAGRLGPAIRLSELKLGFRAKDLLDYLARCSGAAA
jgi:predicted DNA-binding transcriptional regulator AlpA